jgi:hypothetical protein
MSNISVADMLKMHGMWIESTKLTQMMAKKLKLTERQAYRLIKKAALNGEILKLTLSNRNVLYGLPEFGSPQQSNDQIQKKTTENQPIFNEKEISGLAGMLQSDKRWLRNRAKLEIWLRRGARPEEWTQLE